MKNTETSLIPREIVEFLDRYIVGQKNAKRSVAIALRNRWRRMQVPEDLQEEIMPKNIIMIGPTGVGKTEIARRISKLVKAPFIKVEASKFTEVGYVGRDVESMIRDLAEISINITRKEEIESVQEKAKENVEARILDLLIPTSPIKQSEDIETAIRDDSNLRDKFAQKLENGELDEKLIDIQVQSKAGGPSIEFFPITGSEGMDINIKDMMSSFLPKQTQKRSVTVAEARKFFHQEEAEKLLNMDDINTAAIKRVEQSGIIFLDEIDKITSKSDNYSSGEVSREGVQRDLLPVVEGSTVNTKYGPVKTDHILFIAAGAFHVSKPSDLIPELQGRFPIRVELDSLSKDDLVRILTEPKNSLVRQYVELLKTEEVVLEFRDDAIEELARISSDVNNKTENIGARRLHAILEKLLEEVSFNAPELSGQTIALTKKYVQDRLSDIAKDQDLSRYIL
ncbi:MAG: ATP-dependent protease ATPase subunit HslU [Proteobacteria bacterium]|nr:ATP-dependent protease ATPase subunit HslU [Pseudomonadota bacterium]